MVFSDLLDVGDMVDLGGQVGIVESVGMRFTVLVNFSGARVFVPNRSIANVINYPNGYVRAYLDARLPADPSTRDDAERRLRDLAQAAYEQYPGILLLPPTVEGRYETRGGYSYLRIKFRIWPGQGGVLENAVKAAVTQSLKQLDEQYGDWMVTVHYRAEPRDRSTKERLPRPAALTPSRTQEAEPSAGVPSKAIPAPPPGARRRPVTDLFAAAVHGVAGLAALCFGRRLFWLFVGVAGFMGAFELVPSLLPGQEPWLVLCIALGAGVVGALVAVWLQYLAAALAGFAAGAYAAVPLATALGGTAWIPLLGGALGALLMLLVFDWALILLSALIGARALIAVSGLEGPAATVSWLVLAGIGMAIQASLLSPATPPARKS